VGDGNRVKEEANFDITAQNEKMFLHLLAEFTLALAALSELLRDCLESRAFSGFRSATRLFENSIATCSSQRFRLTSRCRSLF